MKLLPLGEPGHRIAGAGTRCCRCSVVFGAAGSDGEEEGVPRVDQLRKAGDGISLQHSDDAKADGEQKTRAAGEGFKNHD